MDRDKINIDKRLIEDAYRKLKGSVYLDKTVPFLRMQIADFENENVDIKIDEIYEALQSETQWNKFKASILNSIKVLTFPKKVSDKDDGMIEEMPIVISNASGTDVSIEKYNNFIDISIEGHILGILWILIIGRQMDQNLSEFCYGNRLNTKLVFDKTRATASPNLFKPYFTQYESWRNQGLNIAENLVSMQNKSVIITMLDLTRYYYNIELTQEKFKDMTNQYCGNNNDIVNRINMLIYEIIETYSKLCGFSNDCTILPIGFLPSSVIANYYLKDIDVKFRKIEGIKYYGRYVDDMILVTEINNSSTFKQNVLEQGTQYVCNYMIELLKKSSILTNNTLNEDKEDNYFLNDFTKLYFQKDKLRFFYIDKNGYNHILEKIKDDISQNASEFNYIPEVASEDLNFDIFKFERDDTVNKLRSISKTFIDKYTLSKAVGKNVLMSHFAEDEIIRKFANELIQILNHREILNNYTLWESVLNYYVINDCIDEIYTFSESIFSAIRHMDEDENKCGEYEYLNNNQIIQVGDSLVYYYFACLTRATAIHWNSKIRQVLEKICKDLLKSIEYQTYNYLYSMDNIDRIRRMYCTSKMINKNLLAVSIDDCIASFKTVDQDSDNKFFSLGSYLETNSNNNDWKKEKYVPYIQTPFEILYSHLINQIKDHKQVLDSDLECINTLTKEYAKNFRDEENDKFLKKYVHIVHKDNCNDYIVEIKTDSNTKNLKYKIAKKKEKMEDSDIINILKDRPHDRSKRCKEIAGIVNEAIHYKADILVFPEAYIPLEYIKILQAKVAEHNMIIIGGIEHIKQDNLVYNLTTILLPIKNKYMSYSVPFFHQKNFFSPQELETVEKYNCIAATGKKHTLFKCNDIYFAVYCCYELTSISLRHMFQGFADIIFGVEWNKDTHYFGNIMEALSRDLYCYCVQSNMSEYGDSRIIRPTKKDYMDILNVKGGLNATVLIGEIDIQELRNHQQRDIDRHNEPYYKPLPAGWDCKK